MHAVGWLFSLWTTLIVCYGNSGHEIRTCKAGPDSGSCKQQARNDGATPFSSVDVVIVDTLNMYATVTNKYKLILVAFYDPRSPSFRHARSSLEKAAKTLALLRAEEGNHDIGVIAACDIVTNNFLAIREASEAFVGYQPRDTSQPFKFGASRWFHNLPLVLKLYYNGEQRETYEGDISSESIVKYVTEYSLPESAPAFQQDGEPSLYTSDSFVAYEPEVPSIRSPQEDPSVPFYEIFNDTPDFVNRISSNAPLQHKQNLAQRFSQLYQFMSRTRVAYNRYYSHLKFSWKFLDQVTAMHPHLPGVGWPNAEDLASVLTNQTLLQALKGAIEARAEFLQPVWEKLPNGGERWKWYLDDSKYIRILKKCMLALAEKFRELYTLLDDAARRGDIPRRPKKLQVDRRDASELTMQAFFENYAKKGVPVLITGQPVSRFTDWTNLSFFRERCAEVPVQVQKKVANLSSWGSLTTVGTLSMADFIDAHQVDQSLNELYLVDWRLPLNCAEVFGELPWDDFIIPKYSAGDYFQRVPFSSYKHSYPSLFTGGPGTGVAMHTDSVGLNFMLHLLSGEKLVRFYHRNESINLYEVPGLPTYRFDPFKPDFKKYPLAEYAPMYEVKQKATELLFIPGGSPHAVENPTAVHGIARQYVDASNVDLYLHTALLENNFEAFEDMVDDFPTGLQSEQQDLTFGQWKSMLWQSMTYDIA